MLLADELWCIGHEHRSGRSRLDPRTTGVGLAAALLAEFVLSGHVQVHGGGVLVARRDPPADMVAHRVLTLLVGQPQHRAVGVWLQFLAGDAVQLVGERLALAGHVAPVRRGRWRSSAVFVPTESGKASWPEIRLARLLVRGEPMTLADVTLAALVDAVGLTDHVLWDSATRERGRRTLQAVLPGLPPGLAQLIGFCTAAVGDAALVP